MELLEHNRKQAQPLMRGKGTALKPIAGAALSSSPQSCTLSGSVAPVCGILTVKVNAEGLDDSVSSKCNEKQECSDVQDTMKPIAGKELCSSPQSGIPSCTVVAPDSGILPSMTKGEGLCDYVSSKCNEPRACSDVQDTLKETRLHCQTSDSGSADSVVEDCEGEPVREKSDLNSSCKIVSIEGGHAKIDVNRIRDTFRKRRRDRITNRKLVEDKDDEMDSEAWIERELENGIKLESANAADKRRRL